MKISPWSDPVLTEPASSSISWMIGRLRAASAGVSSLAMLINGLMKGRLRMVIPPAESKPSLHIAGDGIPSSAPTSSRPLGSSDIQTSSDDRRLTVEIPRSGVEAAARRSIA
jgi:hypothetical protein